MSYSNTCPKVTLRQRPGANGRISLYLDYYPAVRNPKTMKMTRREFLGIYIFDNPTDPAFKEFNEVMLQKAETIRCQRQISLLNEEFNLPDNTKRNADALKYFNDYSRYKGDKYIFVCAHFSKFVNGKCTFNDITVELCNKFREYLLGARQLKHTNQKLSRNAAAAYWRNFRAMLKKAYLEKYLKENLNDYLETIDEDDVYKEFLTAEELKRLATTPCKIDVLRRASLFSCLTGLRFSDVQNLQWENIMPASDGGYCMRIRTIKTGTDATLPISDEALDLCGYRGQGKVFKGFTKTMTQHPLKQWLLDAGIYKPFSFHCFRHTYATLQIAAGTDIYTVSKMLTHRNVTTTQIYADLVNAKKRETVNKITLK